MGSLIILTWHGLGAPQRPLDAGEERVWQSADRFAECVQAAQRYEGVQITFDDGNESDHEIALPVLLKHGLQATFFVCASRFDMPGFLSRAQVRELVKAGMSIGLHGMHHRSWRGLSAVELEEEIGEASRRIADASGVPVREAACPFGGYDRRSLSALRKARIQRVYTSDRGRASQNAWLQARNTVYSTDTAESVAAMITRTPPLASRLSRSIKGVVKRWR